MVAKRIVNKGDISPHHPHIEVAYEVFKNTDKGDNWRRYVAVKCNICCLDVELYGDGIFIQTLDRFMKGSLPCGCAASRRLTRDQWQIHLRRCANAVGLEYRGYIGEWVGDKGNIILYCRKHDYEYYNGYVGGLSTGNGCPKCGNEVTTSYTRKEDSYYINNWRQSTHFIDGTSFNRISKRMWEVICPLCPDRVFLSDYSNLNAGKRPCDCSKRGGYNKYLSGYVYIIKVDGMCGGFTGFGITNSFNKRLAEHTRNLRKGNLSIIDSYDYFFEDGSIPLDIEKAIKYKFPLARQEIVGFKTEATHYDLFLDVRNFVEDYIENAAK